MRKKLTWVLTDSNYKRDRPWSEGSCWSTLICVCTSCLQKQDLINPSTAAVALTLSPLVVNFEDRWWPLQTIWIQMKPHKMWGFIWDPYCLTFRLYISIKKMGGNNEFFENFERNKYLKKLPSMERVKVPPVYKNANHSSFEWPFYPGLTVNIASILRLVG